MSVLVELGRNAAWLAAMSPAFAWMAWASWRERRLARRWP